jgi:hypothetical protein
VAKMAPKTKFNGTEMSLRSTKVIDSEVTNA